MLIGSVVLFALAALGGVVASLRLLRGEQVPWALSAGHGVLAAAGLVILIAAVMAAPGSGGPVLWSLGLFVLAALGGFGLFAMHLMGKSAPKAFVGGHGALAVVAFVLLLLGTFGS